MSRPRRTPAAPPRWLSAWTRLVRDLERREFLAGDLEEEYGRRAARDSVAAARRWYVSQLVRSLVAFGSGRDADGPGRPPAQNDRRRPGRLDALQADLRDALRGLRATPAPALIIAATLALGVGANAAMIGIADAVLFRPLPYPDPDRLLWIHAAGADAASRYQQLTYQDVERLRAADVGLADVGAYSGAGRTLQVPGVEPLELDFARVTAGFFEALDVDVAPGRRFTAEELRDGAPVIILSHAFWMQRLAGDPSIVGGDVRIRGEAHRVVGIASPEMTFPAGAVFWRPLTAEERSDDDRELRAVARLADGASLREVGERLAAASPALLPAGDESNGRLTLWAETLRSTLVHDSRTPLLVLLGGAGVVLLIACANVANLLLARTEARRRSLAMRAALGAARVRIVRLQMLETGLLTVAGGAAGTLAGALLVPLLVRLAPAGTPRIESAAVDLRLIGIMTALLAATALLAGVLPALSFSAVAPREAMSGGDSRQVGRVAGRRARAGLVSAQVALSTMLAIGAVLCLATVANLASSPPGFEPADLASVELYPSSGALTARGGNRAYATLAEEAVRGVAGVVAVGAGSHTPVEGRGINARLFGLRVGDGQDGLPADTGVVEITPEYLRAAGMRLIAGRTFTAADDAEAPRVALVSERFLAAALGGVEPAAVLGRRLTSTDLRSGAPVEVEVVGVVADLQPDPRTPPRPLVFFPSAQNGVGYGNLLIRYSGDPASLLAEVRARLAAFDGSLPLNRIELASLSLGAFRAAPRFLAQVLLAFGGLALALAALGTYSVVAYTVVRRTREFGLRRALGAHGPRIVAEVLGREAQPIAAGVLCGLVGALVAARLLDTVLFGVAGFEPRIYMAIASVVALAAIVAAYLPARRAARVDPLVSLQGR